MLNIECSYAKIRFSFLKQLRGIIDNKPQLRQYFDRIYSELRKTTSELVNYSLSIVNHPLLIIHYQFIQVSDLTSILVKGSITDG